MLVATESQHEDWSADYRAFSRAEWNAQKLFDIPKRRVLSWIPAESPIIAALDDTKLQKTGRKIPGVSYQRDPMSPPFHTNLIRAQRFVQISVTVPLKSESVSPVRAFPVAFEHSPPPAKPLHTATEEEHKQYRVKQRTQNLSQTGVRMITNLRRDYDSLGQTERKLVMTVDGSYTNKSVLRNLPDRTAMIGRIRKDAKFFYAPEIQPERGRKRLYGNKAPTPEQLRVDESNIWQPVEAFAAGRQHTFNVKTIDNLLWPKAGVKLPVRLIVIRPLGYRLTKSGRTLYRQPAYLICTDPDLSLQQIIQWYVWRWEIEVNHRDEKQLIGVGQAQVRSEKAVERVPAFAVASYSMLLVASALCNGIDARVPIIEPPKWRTKAVGQQIRLTTGQIIEQFQKTPTVFMAHPNSPENLRHFAYKKHKHAKYQKIETVHSRAS